LKRKVSRNRVCSQRNERINMWTTLLTYSVQNRSDPLLPLGEVVQRHVARWARSRAGGKNLVASMVLLYDPDLGATHVRRLLMKVVVDQQLCEGNMRCQEAAPEMFEVRDDDKSHLLIANPPERMREKIKLAARLCPRQAILVTED
jgi:ferredoxin